MEHTQPRVEETRNLERLTTTHDLAGVQGRFLLRNREMLNPQVNVTEQVESNALISDFSVYSNASTYERSSETGSIAQWSTEVSRKITEPTRFFQSEKGQMWTEAFNKTFGFRPSEFTQETAKALYDKYFTDDGKSNVERFVNDVVGKYTEDGTVNMELLTQHMPAIRWVAGVFGGQSSHMVEQLIFAQAKMQASDAAVKEEFLSSVNEQNRMNTLSRPEEELLQFVYYASQRQNPPPLGPETIDTSPAPAGSDTEPSASSADASPETPSIPEQQHKVDAAKVADALVDYTTGMAKDGVDEDLSAYVEELKERTKVMAEKKEGAFADPEDPAKKPVARFVLSDVAWEMMRKMAFQSNGEGMELAFVLNGTTIGDEEDNIFLGSYIIPATDYGEQRKNAEAGTAHKNVKPNEGTANPNLHQLENSTKVKGDDIVVMHTHLQSYGAEFSDLDKDFAKSYKKDHSTRKTTYLAVVQLKHGLLSVDILPTTTDDTGEIKNGNPEQVQIIHESDLFAAPTAS